MPSIPVWFDITTFLIGFLTASIFWWLVGKARPLWTEVQQDVGERLEEAQARGKSTVEVNHRRITLRRAQGMHLAAPLFALNEILVEPLLMSPPPVVEPGSPPVMEDLITQTVPYLPAWPELAAVYRTASLTMPQALSGGSNLVIIGQPGTGKTVTLAYLASLAANRDEKLGDLKDAVPFLFHVADLKLPVANIKDVLKPISDAASEYFPFLDITGLPSFVKTTFKNDRALLLLDGFDELTAEGQNVVSEYFKILLKSYPNARIVTTGAPEYLDGLISLGFAPLAILLWSEQRSAQFIEHWGELWTHYRSLESSEKTRSELVDPILLNNWLSADKSILSPLEITLKAWGAYAGDSLGPTVLEAIATHIRRIAPADTPLAALEALAMQVVLEAQPIFDPRNARQWVRSFEPVDEKQDDEGREEQSTLEALQESNPGKKELPGIVVPTPTPGLLGKMAASGLLISHPNNQMRFCHLVFKGYLAGRALSNYHASEVLFNQPDWSGKYLALRYLAAHGDAGPLVQQMMEWSRLPMHRPLLTAARWLRDAPRTASWCGKLLGTLAALLQTEGIPLSLRGQALAAFIISGDPSVAALFRQLVGASSYELVQLAALGSGAMKDIKAIPILERLVVVPNVSVRRAACMALATIGTNEALEIVAHLLLNADEDVRRAATETLANDPGEGYAMLKDGATMKDVYLRRAVIYGLIRVDESWSIELLQKIQKEESQWGIRNAASEALVDQPKIDPRAPHKLRPPSESRWLVEFADKRDMSIPPGAHATDVLLLALKSEDPDLRLASLPYLKYLPTEGVINQLYNALYKNDLELRETVYQVLWEMGASGVKLPNPSQYGLS
jgi:HEAT repeat protein